MGLSKRVSPRMRYYRRHTAKYFKQNFLLLVLGAEYLLGILLGTRVLSAAELGAAQDIERMLKSFIAVRTQGALNTTFISSFLSSSVFLLFIFICGFCAVAVPIILLCPIFKGIGFGAIAASMIASYGGAGAVYCGVLLLPNAVLGGVVCLWACRDALLLSRDLLLMLRGQGPSGGVGIATYCTRFAVLLGAAAGIAGLEGVLFSVLSPQLMPM